MMIKKIKIILFMLIVTGSTLAIANDNNSKSDLTIGEGVNSKITLLKKGTYLVAINRNKCEDEGKYPEYVQTLLVSDNGNSIKDLGLFRGSSCNTILSLATLNKEDGKQEVIGTCTSDVKPKITSELSYFTIDVIDMETMVATEYEKYSVGMESNILVVGDKVYEVHISYKGLEFEIIKPYPSFYRAIGGSYEKYRMFQPLYVENNPLYVEDSNVALLGISNDEISIYDYNIYTYKGSSIASGWSKVDANTYLSAKVLPNSEHNKFVTVASYNNYLYLQTFDPVEKKKIAIKNFGPKKSSHPELIIDDDKLIILYTYEDSIKYVEENTPPAN
ncbi:hypothetical protein LO80_01730 [Candidatus Francisella endociliophora]|uniref:Uncharacterized protein n=1 Tax=Candidatus Francisella endociliophora TaxID=653937 RepID=A0A097EMN3_9GAMM|nr:hypothetical protein [Francisella sp. FSC1006]AIT08820.1 hypothetical protein LO80_01730 [Francisella sp. FSC1006]